MSERDIAEKMIADAEKLAAEGKAKLAELDEPELRHGDYGVGKDKSGRPRFRLMIRNDVYNGESTKNPTNRDPNKDVWLGNIFDDLKRNAEDLKEFEVDNLRVVLDKQRGDAMVFFKSICSDRTFTINEATEIHQKLGQLIATAKRKQK